MAGGGLWLFAGGPGDGWIASPGANAVRQMLPERLVLATVAALAKADTAHAFGVRLGDQVLAAELPADTLALTVPKALLASQPIAFSGGVRGSMTVESARLRVLV